MQYRVSRGWVLPFTVGAKTIEVGEGEVIPEGVMTPSQTEDLLKRGYIHRGSGLGPAGSSVGRSLVGNMERVGGPDVEPFVSSEAEGSITSGTADPAPEEAAQSEGEAVDPQTGLPVVTPTPPSSGG